MFADSCINWFGELIIIIDQECNELFFCFVESSGGAVSSPYQGGPKERFDISHMSSGITENDLEQVLTTCHYFFYLIPEVHDKNTKTL